MKKVFFLFLTVVTTGIINANAQNCTPSHPGYTTVPDSGITIPKILPSAQVGVYYEQALTFGVADSAKGYPLNWVQYTSLTNDITANTWTTVNSTGGTTFTQWNKQTWQCATIKGTPTTAGTDSLRIFVTANVTILGYPYTQNNVNAFVVPLVVTSATGLPENINADIKFIKSYPNPATDKITIDVSTSLNSPTTIEILNIQGQTILKKQLQQEKTDIDISGIAKGVYILKSNNDKNIDVIRFVKE